MAVAPELKKRSFQSLKNLNKCVPKLSTEPQKNEDNNSTHLLCRTVQSVPLQKVQLLLLINLRRIYDGGKTSFQILDFCRRSFGNSGCITNVLPDFFSIVANRKKRRQSGFNLRLNQTSAQLFRVFNKFY